MIEGTVGQWHAGHVPARLPAELLSKTNQTLFGFRSHVDEMMIVEQH